MFAVAEYIGWPMPDSKLGTQIMKQVILTAQKFTAPDRRVLSLPGAKTEMPPRWNASSCSVPGSYQMISPDP